MALWPGLIQLWNSEDAPRREESRQVGEGRGSARRLRIQKRSTRVNSRGLEERRSTRFAYLDVVSQSKMSVNKGYSAAAEGGGSEEEQDM